MRNISKKLVAVTLAFVLAFGGNMVTRAAEPVVRFSSIPSAEAIQTMKESYRAPVPYKDICSERGITPDGYQRVYGEVILETTNNNDTYEFLGEVSTYNSSPNPMNLRYTQGSSKTSHWDVSGNVSGTGEISVPLISKVEATIGVAVSKSNTITSGTEVGADMIVDAYKSGKITAYQKAVYVKGYIKYNDYAPDGTGPVRSGTETVSGSLVKKNAYHLVTKQW